MTLGELATAKQENTDIAILLMNDGGYGVIKNISDAVYGGRRQYSDILAPDWSVLCDSLDIPHWGIDDAKDLAATLKQAFDADGPALIEIDMKSIGDFAQAFAGPPKRAADDGDSD